jgi:lipopolysaccharide export system protein LptC
MIDLSQPTSPENGAFGGEMHRADAFRAAARHSARVRFWRRTLLVGCLAGIAALAAYSYIDPFGRAAVNLTVGETGLDGTRVTMRAPKLSGYHADGRPYDVRAASGVQDIRTPNSIDLNQIDARFSTAEGAAVHLVAPAGTYDSTKDFMKLRGDVHIVSDSGYDIRMKDADIGLKAGTVATQQPVTVQMSGGNVVADRLNMVDNGHRIIFEGNVRSVLQPRDDSTTSHESQGSQP